MEDSDQEIERTPTGRKVKFMHPPTNSKEALVTLKEVDARFEAKKKYLAGIGNKLKSVEKNTDEQKRELL